MEFLGSPRLRFPSYNLRSRSIGTNEDRDDCDSRVSGDMSVLQGETGGHDRVHDRGPRAEYFGFAACSPGTFREVPTRLIAHTASPPGYASGLSEGHLTVCWGS